MISATVVITGPSFRQYTTRWSGGGVPDQAGDLFDADAVMAHQAHEGGAELTWCPAASDACCLACPLEHLPGVHRVEGNAEVAHEHQPGVRPPSPGTRSS
jgi:hypothetical protein